MRRHQVANRPSPAETITNAIIERLEKGVRPWRQPWTGSVISRPLRACGTAYRGINVFWLWITAEANGFSSACWMTYRQAQVLGGQVRKGERGTIAIFYTSYVSNVEDPDTGEEQDETRRVLKSYTVFNADQVDGLPVRFAARPKPLSEPTARDADLDGFFAAIPATVRSGKDACYLSSTDEITMPDIGAFADRDQYRATLAHELAHWTGHESRLARSLGQRFGSDAYAVEELIAELASAMLGAELGLPVDHLDDHASYLASWLKVLKADSRAILTAAAKAEQAASLLLELGGRRERVSEEPASPDSTASIDNEPLALAA